MIKALYILFAYRNEDYILAACGDGYYYLHEMMGIIITACGEGTISCMRFWELLTACGECTIICMGFSELLTACGEGAINCMR